MASSSMMYDDNYLDEHGLPAVGARVRRTEFWGHSNNDSNDDGGLGQLGTITTYSYDSHYNAKDHCHYAHVTWDSRDAKRGKKYPLQAPGEVDAIEPATIPHDTKVYVQEAGPGVWYHATSRENLDKINADGYLQTYGNTKASEGYDGSLVDSKCPHGVWFSGGYDCKGQIPRTSVYPEAVDTKYAKVPTLVFDVHTLLTNNGTMKPLGPTSTDKNGHIPSASAWELFRVSLQVKNFNRRSVYVCALRETAEWYWMCNQDHFKRLQGVICEPGTRQPTSGRAGQGGVNGIVNGDYVICDIQEASDAINSQYGNKGGHLSARVELRFVAETQKWTWDAVSMLHACIPPYGQSPDSSPPAAIHPTSVAIYFMPRYKPQSMRLAGPVVPIA
eukprot:4679300-Prymnesium_polylepis.1